MKKYLTEEERKAAKRESDRRYRQNHKEKIAEYNAVYNAEYYQNNKEKILEQKAEYYQNNKEKIAEQKAEYYQNNKEKILEQKAEYYSTPKGRANSLLTSYRQEDEKRNRGECTLTAEWIVEHIFTKPCHYCGKTDWHELGCDRIDNSLPHVPNNVVPCCTECNNRRGTTPYEEYLKLVGKGNAD